MLARSRLNWLSKHLPSGALQYRQTSIWNLCRLHATRNPNSSPWWCYVISPNFAVEKRRWEGESVSCLGREGRYRGIGPASQRKRTGLPKSPKLLRLGNGLVTCHDSCGKRNSSATLQIISTICGRTASQFCQRCGRYHSSRNRYLSVFGYSAVIPQRIQQLQSERSEFPPQL